MAPERGTGTGIAVNVARTRVTVLVFNLTIITFILSILRASGAKGGMLTTAALFTGFCLTLLGIYLLLASQDLDAEGLSRPWPFTLGSITTYLALSQTVTAFIHEYLVWLESVVEADGGDVTEHVRNIGDFDVLGDGAMLILLVMGAVAWVLITYIGPLTVGLRSPVRSDLRWVFAGYYFALQVPIYWVYAKAWHLQYAPAGQPTNMLNAFALQFAQPLLWFR